MYRVVVHRRAARYVKRLSAPEKSRLKKRLGQLAQDPDSVRGSKAMRGEWRGYRRLRVGDLRVIYWIDEEEKSIFVDHVGPRGDIYY